MFWKGRVRVGSTIMVRPWGGAEYSVQVQELSGSGRGRKAKVKGHTQVNGEWIGQALWTRLVQA